MNNKSKQVESVESHVDAHTNDNANFVQVSREYLKHWRALTKKSPIASEILLYLVENMGRTSNAVVCSYKTLEEITGTSRATVGRAIKILKEDQWLDTVKVGSATAYGINARIFWQAARNQKQYAVFSATVIASESEQAKGFRDKATHSLKHIPFIEKSDSVVIENVDLLPPDQQDLDI